MEIPKFHETFNPILDILKNGETIHSNDLYKNVITKFYSELTPEQLREKTKSGDLLIKNRIAWGKSYLKKGGFIEYPQRGFVKVTAKGLNQKNELSLKGLVEEKSLLDFYQEENNKTLKSSTQSKELKNSTPQDLIDEGFKRIEHEIKSDLLQKLKTIDPYFFEKVILKLLNKMGYGDFIETSKSADGGIDGIINEDKLGLDKIYIQAKRFTENKVREKDIRNFIGAMSGDTNKGVFVTTSQFDQAAVQKAKDAHHKIILIDGNKLVDLMHEYNIGVQIKHTIDIKHLDEDFFLDQ